MLLPPLLLPVLLTIAPAIALAASDSASASEPHALIHPPAAPSPTPPADLSQDYALLDIVLVASVDGKFHALNRTSGHTLWSMAGFATTTSVSAPSSLAPLVRTTHAKRVPLDEDEDEEVGEKGEETYIIEPQSGAIYILRGASAPLQRFPFSMAELVDISPFTSVNGNDTKVFVGKKETSLLLIELETGRIKATLNAECPFIPDEYQDVPIDLDELEGSKPPTSAPTEVYIGRTDYIISIHKKPKHGLPAPPPQELSFSSYGPNNKDNHLQTLYRQTNDGTYVQSLTNGEIIAFRTQGQGKKGKSKVKEEEQNKSGPLWGHRFGVPVVAIFDVLKALPSTPHAHTHPFVLLQPRPKLQDLFPKLTAGTNAGISGDDALGQLNNLASAYVGLVEESGSLFVMSPERYPLVVFGGGRGGVNKNKETAGRKELDAGGYDEDEDCGTNGNDARCLVGVRALEDGDGMEGRMRRLLDGPKTQLPASSPLNEPYVSVGWTTDADNASGRQSHDIGNVRRPLGIEDGRTGIPQVGPSSAGIARQAWQALLVTILIGVLGVWAVWGRVKKSEKEVVPEVVKVQVIDSTVEELATPPEVTEKELPALPEATKKEPPAPLDIPSPLIPDTPGTGTPGPEDGEDSEEEGAGLLATPGKRKARRGKRGKKKKSEDKSEEKPPSLVLTPKPPVVHQPSLVVSDSVLGFGSHGTVVFRGSLQGRAVAVKRLLQDFVTLASREVSILQESDDHPNVIRYYYQESHANFLYIALELCPCSLADIIENPLGLGRGEGDEKEMERLRDMAINFDPKSALRQIARGLGHLHALKLVHRDIKPQNILVGVSPSTTSKGKGAGYRMLISDFGLCKKLDVDQTSFLPTAHGAAGAGTVGWRAPEILRGEVKLDEPSNGDDSSLSSRGSVATVNGSSIHSTGSGSGPAPTRLTKSVDIFALGCLFYYTLTSGSHPYGDRFEREVNIMRDAKDLSGLERFGEEGEEGRDLIRGMLSFEARGRPDTATILLHPFFWDPLRRLNFLQDASDRFEIMTREPRDANLVTLERGAHAVVGTDWHARLDRIFIDNLGKYRKYDGRSVQDLLRALRNKKHHYQDLPDNVKRHLGPMPEGFLAYFTRRYPQLFLHVHAVVGETGLARESMFRTYFELTDT